MTERGSAAQPGSGAPAGPVPVAPGLDAARGWLTGRLGARDVAPLGAGAWSRAFALRSGDGRELVARFGLHRDDFEADRAAASFAGPDLPVPATVLVEPALGGFVSVTTRCHGTFLEELEASAWASVRPSLARSLRALWEIEPTQLPAPDAQRFGAGTPWADRLLSVSDDSGTGRGGGWRRQLAASSLGDASFRTGYHVLKDLSADPAVAGVRTRLVHSDLINRNVLVDGHATNGPGPRISGIFDWGCCIVADPLYDLAWLEFWAPWHPGLATLDIRAWARQLVPARDGFAERWLACCLHIGLGHLAYNASIGDEHNLIGTDRRLASYLAQA